MKILDFGVALVLNLVESPEARLTRTGTISAARATCRSSSRRRTASFAQRPLRRRRHPLPRAHRHAPFVGKTIGEVMHKIMRHEIPPLAEERGRPASGALRLHRSRARPPAGGPLRERGGDARGAARVDPGSCARGLTSRGRSELPDREGYGKFGCSARLNYAAASAAVVVARAVGARRQPSWRRPCHNRSRRTGNRRSSSRP